MPHVPPSMERELASGLGPVKVPVGSGLVVVDKPAGLTSHDIVSRVRRLAGTRKVGHAGTLDPMATGVLLLGVEKATRLLGHLASTDKSYDATIRLGAATGTDDAEGDVITPRHELTGDGRRKTVHEVTGAAIRAEVLKLTGDIEQRPSAVSAIKVDGVRAYARVRKGEDVALPARAVTVSVFDVFEIRAVDAMTTLTDAEDSAAESAHTVVYPALDVDVTVSCSTGTYIRALARDLGEALGVGGHLTSLRRTRVGPYDISSARSLEQLTESFDVIPLSRVVADTFARIEVDEADAAKVRNGVRLAWPPDLEPTGPIGVFAPDGGVLALAEHKAGSMAYLAVLD